MTIQKPKCPRCNGPLKVVQGSKIGQERGVKYYYCTVCGWSTPVVKS